MSEPETRCDFVVKVDANQYPPSELLCGEEAVPYTDRCPQHALCCHEVRIGTIETPPEYCDEDAVPGEKLCAAHKALVDRMDEHERLTNEQFEMRAASDMEEE